MSLGPSRNARLIRCSRKCLSLHCIGFSCTRKCRASSRHSNFARQIPFNCFYLREIFLLMGRRRT
ncbi:hypothetical protein BDV18DRAFT_141902 [Aspergillus unguis]